MITLKKINSETVKPIILNVFDKTKVLGYDLFPNPFCNIFLCARKNSGKTNVISTIINSSYGKDTVFHIFSSTAKKDATWKHIIECLQKKKLEVNVYLSIKDGKVDLLKPIVDALKKDDLDESNETDLVNHQPLIICDNSFSKERRSRKSSMIYPKVIFVFDDVGDELSSPSVSQLLQINRHFGRVIISSQNVTDLHPKGRRQINYWLLFGGHVEDKLKTIHSNAALPLEFDEFKNIYNIATEEKFNFLYADVDGSTYRKNFNQKFMITE